MHTTLPRVVAIVAVAQRVVYDRLRLDSQARLLLLLLGLGGSPVAA